VSLDTEAKGRYGWLYGSLDLSVICGLGRILVLLTLFNGEFQVVVGAEVLIMGLFATSGNLLYGYMGEISFGHSAFFGLGAYTTALFMRAFQGPTGEIGYLPFLISIFMAIPVSALGALIIGFFCVRLTGIYFAMLSLAFAELLYYIVFSWYSFTKGDDGIQGLLPPPWLQGTTHYYYFALLVIAGTLVFLWRITNSPFSYVLRMLRENKNRAAFVGVNVRTSMLVNFVIAGAFAGLAGGLWGPFQRSVSPVLLGSLQSATAVFMILMGGPRFFVGPLVGSTIYTVLNAYLTRFTVYWPLTIGSIILIFVFFLPGGILSAVQRWIRASLGHRSKSSACMPVERK
jgi:branched-chain amino acid transport system permease protein